MEKANVPLRQRGDRYADFVCCANHRRMASVSTVATIGLKRFWIWLEYLYFHHMNVQISNFCSNINIGVWALNSGWASCNVFCPLAIVICLPIHKTFSWDCRTKMVSEFKGEFRNVFTPLWMVESAKVLLSMRTCARCPVQKMIKIDFIL